MGRCTTTTTGTQILLVLLPASALNIISDWPAQTVLQNNAAFDYIVAGGGSAGCVVTTRLVEDKRNSVLMIEGGDDPPLQALLPGLFFTLQKSSVDYNYQSTFDPYAAGSQGNFTTLSAGKMLGGSHSLNHFFHTRGCSSVFDGWADITEDNSWSYENLLKYFIKSERTKDDKIMNTYPEYHGTDGPIGLTRQTSKEVSKYLKAFAEFGLPPVLDLNANITLGIAQPLYSLADKKRQTSAKEYLQRVKDYSNLHVTKNTRVTRIIFEDNVAKAVEAVYQGKTYTFRANKEIILSAGVYNSPQILMLSGIGPEDHLTTMGIDVISNLPVGNSFTDQSTITLGYKMKKHLLPVPGLTKVVPDPTKIPFPVLLGYLALNKTQKCPDYTIYALLIPHDTPDLTITCRNALWYRMDICVRWQIQVIGRDMLYMIVSNVRPRSRGIVRLKSTNPIDDPIITTGFLTNSEDLENMVKYIKNLIQVGDTCYFKKVKAELVGLDLPECANEELWSDDFWRCYIRNMAVSVYHGTGTCAMGDVVDGTLQLKGFERIRIIDASVIPIIPTCPNNAAVLAVAERGADIIKSTPYY